MKSDILEHCARGKSGETRMHDIENRLRRLEAATTCSGRDSSAPVGEFPRTADLSAVTRRLSDMTKEMEILKRENEELRRRLIPAGADAEHRDGLSPHSDLGKSTVSADQHVPQKDREAKRNKENSRKSKKRTSLILGAAENSCAVEKRPFTKRLHVARVKPGVTTGAVLETVRSWEVQRCTVHRIKPKHEGYTSFCVEVDEEDFSTIKDPGKWTKDLVLCEYGGSPKPDQIL